MRKIPFLLILFLCSVFLCFAQNKAPRFEKVDWIFSEQDFNLNIQEAQVTKGPHTFEISRKFSTDAERALIKKAEALYPKENAPKKLLPAINSGEYKKGTFSPEKEESPFWSTGSFDGVKIAGIIATRTIRYYQDLSAAFRDNKKPTSIEMSETSFTYSAHVEHFDKYEIAAEKFENANVVFMKISWSQFCGGLCAMGFEREKIVVFDNNGNPAAMFLNFGNRTWVS